MGFLHNGWGSHFISAEYNSFSFKCERSTINGNSKNTNLFGTLFKSDVVRVLVN